MPFAFPIRLETLMINERSLYALFPLPIYLAVHLRISFDVLCVMCSEINQNLNSSFNWWKFFYAIQLDSCKMRKHALFFNRSFSFKFPHLSFVFAPHQKKENMRVKECSFHVDLSADSMRSWNKTSVTIQIFHLLQPSCCVEISEWFQIA